MNDQKPKPKVASRRKFPGQAITVAGTVVAAPSLLGESTANGSIPV